MRILRVTPPFVSLRAVELNTDRDYSECGPLLTQVTVSFIGRDFGIPLHAFDFSSKSNNFIKKDFCRIHIIFPVPVRQPSSSFTLKFFT